MDESNINWGLATACLLLGIGIGALGYHLLNARAGQLQSLRKRIAERDRELTALRNGLSDHLNDTTALVENLRRDSDALARRLEQDAQSLGGNVRPRQNLEVPKEAGEETANPALSTPRDYAAGTGGTLSEDFGLKSDESGPQPPRY